LIVSLYFLRQNSSYAGLTRLRGRSRFGEAKARVSIDLQKSLWKKMDGRVKPGHDGECFAGLQDPRLEHCSPDAAQRAALRGVVRCRAGAVTNTTIDTVPALRSGMKNAAPRPGHSYHFSP
jgi:hypothetical protein